ncbi:MAG TPA: LLM class F420-dependent oxidoreductase, partial [Streptosporangiaceae bacterium]|nr:LLM class F420-dependent oxidoreductase [Streptosporangiaceae bacterium]
MFLSYAGGFAETVTDLADYERAGLDIVFVPEAYSFDAVSQLGFIAAKTERVQIASGIFQLYSRTPALTAMTAAGLDYVSGGRFTLGLGASGPQVIEGWHGVPYDAPIGRAREIIEICRMMWKREKVEHTGIYNLPLPEGQGTGLGKALKLINHPIREHIPIYVAAIGNKNVEMTAEIADGWIPLYYSPFRQDVYSEHLAGAKEGFEIPALANITVTDDIEAGLLPVKMMLGFYLGGMGAKSTNFHVDLLNRMGFEHVTGKIQELFFAGKRAEAVAAIPDEMADEIALCGSDARIRDRLSAWR